LTEYTHYGEYPSGRQAVFRFLYENPYHTLGSLKKMLREKTDFVDLKDQTIRNYMTQYRRLYSCSGVVPRLHRGFGVLKSEFDGGLWEVAPCFGWRVSRNRNRERLWSQSGITLGWHRNGTVVFRFKGFRPQGHLLTAFIHAFWKMFLSSGKAQHEVFNYLETLFKERYSQKGFDFVYETWRPLPKLTVKDFHKSYGITIKLGDGSHPTALEVEQREPFWFSKIEKIVDQLGVEIKNHLALIKSWREESVESKKALKELCQTLKQQQKNFDRFMFRLFEFFQRMEERGAS